MPTKLNHTKFMQRCLELASYGIQNVSPNPMVGAVLVYEDRIIGEGYHNKFGEAHAEVNAINSVKPKDAHLIKLSTLYVSLEPCSHHGKTPPCSDLIIEKNIPKVVIACIDSYSEVAGKGIEKLQSKGVEVTVGILEKEARFLNRRFFTFHEKQRPYIILKWAQSEDGFIDKLRHNDKKGINWITQTETQQLTHQWRTEEDGILVGCNTILRDNPSLTARASSGKNPTRIIICSDPSKIESSSNVLDGKVETIIFNDILSKKDENVDFIALKPTKNRLVEILKVLHKKNLQSLIIEGGSKTINSFIAEGLWDEARVLKGKSIFENGLAAPKINSNFANSFKFGKDTINIYYND